jgi:transcriptional regulator with XRE-family HTH domain
MLMSDDPRRAELAHFLRTRRERLSPSLFQLPTGAKRRRTPGLRREELAQIAGISPTWYMKLEQGQEIQVSAQVLESLVRVFQLTTAERTHLYLLARQELPLSVQNHTPQITPDLQRVLNVLNPHPALVLNERWDVVGWNQAACQVFLDYRTLSDWERNLVWLMFTQPDQRVLFTYWECWAQRFLALFRACGAYGAGESWFTERRDRLMQASPEFQAWWKMHEVGEAHMEQTSLNHPRVGSLILQLTALRVVENPHLQLFVYTPLPRMETSQKLMLLQEESLVSISE